MTEGTPKQSQAPLETQDENLNQPESLSELKNKIKDNLTQLVLWDLQLESQGKNIKELLSQSKEELDSLKKNHPNDPDIYLFEQMYEDLIGDFEKEEETNLDTSFDSILKNMGDIIESSGIKRETPDSTILSDTIERLRALDIEPEYVVTQGDQNAPTIVLYMQIHPGSDSEGIDQIKESQAQIKKEISGAIEANLIDTVYTEGIYEGHELGGVLDKVDKERVSGYAPIDLEIKYGDRINVQGYENEPLLHSVIFSSGSEKYRKWMHRATSHNVLLASNISEDIAQKNKSLSFAVLGAAHEDASFWELEEHPLPMSEVLAYYGVNVIVVDAVTEDYKSTDKLDEALAAIKTELSK